MNETTFTVTMLLGQGTLVTDFVERRPEDLSPATIERIREQDPEVVIIGTGSRHVFPASGVEVMSTSAACRTYNILSAEGRRVVALLLPIE